LSSNTGASDIIFRKLKKRLSAFFVIVLVVAGIFIWNLGKNNDLFDQDKNVNEGGPGQASLHPLSIEAQRKKEYPGSEIVIEQTLSSGSNYQKYIASYKSDGLKIYAFLTVPNSPVPEGGFAAIVFNHGYIPPAEYSTTEKYVAYVDGFAKEGYIVFKPDFRGHGQSEGKPEGAYYSDAYITDVLNAVSSIKRYENVNPAKIGMWGHSMGGHLTLRAMVVSKDVKAGIIWAGVVGSYDDMINRWRRRVPWTPSESERQFRRPGRQELIDRFGTPEQTPEFWKSISPVNYVSDISGPVQLHHGLADESVPSEFSQSLNDALTNAQKTVEFYKYEGADHNLSGSAFGQAMARSVDFFGKYLK